MWKRDEAVKPTGTGRIGIGAGTDGSAAGC